MMRHLLRSNVPNGIQPKGNNFFNEFLFAGALEIDKKRVEKMQQRLKLSLIGICKQELISFLEYSYIIKSLFKDYFNLILSLSM